MENLLNNKRIFLTGATRGIGYELSLLLKSTSAELLLSGSSIKSLERLNVFSQNKNVKLIELDLANPNIIESKAKQIINDYGPIDILINNAGIGIFKNLSNFSLEEYDKIMNINLRSPFVLIREFIQPMLLNNSGIILNVLSVVSKKPFINSSIYGASKSAFLQMSECLRLEVRDKGIKIINVHPGATATEIWSKNALEKFSSKMMTPKEVANIIFNVIKLSLENNLMIEEIQIRPQTGDL